MAHERTMLRPRLVLLPDASDERQERWAAACRLGFSSRLVIIQFHSPTAATSRVSLPQPRGPVGGLGPGGESVRAICHPEVVCRYLAPRSTFLQQESGICRGRRAVGSLSIILLPRVPSSGGF